MVAYALSLHDADTIPPLVRRGQPRVPVADSAAYLSQSRIVIARSADVSMSGAFVGTDLPDPVGTEAFLRLEKAGKPMTFAVKVCRVSFLSAPNGQGRGMGLSFVDLSKEQRRFLASYVAVNHTDDENDLEEIEIVDDA